MDLRHGLRPSCPPIWRAIRHPVRETRWCLQTLPSRPALPWPSHFPHAKCVWEACGGQASLRRALCVAACLPARLCEGGSATSLTNQQQPARSSTKARAGQTPIATSPLLCVIQKPPSVHRKCTSLVALLCAAGWPVATHGQASRNLCSFTETIRQSCFSVSCTSSHPALTVLCYFHPSRTEDGQMCRPYLSMRS
jgi:hypothetical protein